ncbi:hypothetical protein TVNIR_1194 [Thioalkalivibrio nitratireducens DSM 14787]|uniref:Uncharacterized protein n=1 Tax=Thioalkalivibrio nitratireducens (strain DSM 14787 / UNIQEM 213 / ALEN2) TaxID=1255043 RepID=L0DTF5_THIND|nr:hypothetical protein TVNIR_1194 [Thioalkalivibrio nitratireducens DSM 14787]
MHRAGRSAPDLPDGAKPKRTRPAEPPRGRLTRVDCHRQRPPPMMKEA